MSPVISTLRYFVGGPDAHISMGNDEAAFFRLSRAKRCEVEPEDLSGSLVVQLGATTEDLNRRWYEHITGRMPIGRYVAALCYATAVILLAWWPWNILLILPALASRNRNRLRFSIFVAPEASVRSKVFCRGSS